MREREGGWGGREGRVEKVEGKEGRTQGREEGREGGWERAEVGDRGRGKRRGVGEWDGRGRESYLAHHICAEYPVIFENTNKSQLLLSKTTPL